MSNRSTAVSIGFAQFVIASAIAAFLVACGSGASPENPEEDPGPGPIGIGLPLLPPADLETRCESAAGAGSTLAPGDIVVATSDIFTTWDASVLYAIDHDTFVARNLTAENGCNRRGILVSMDSGRRLAAQRFQVGDSSSDAEAVTVYFRFPYTVPLHIVDGPSPDPAAFTDDPSVIVVTGFQYCGGGTGGASTLALHSVPGSMPVRTIWGQSQCDSGLSIARAVTVADRDEHITWWSVRFVDEIPVSSHLFDYRPGTDAEGREVSEIAVPQFSNSPLVYGRDNESVLIPVYGERLPDGHVPFDGYYSASLTDTRRLTQVTPLAADGLEIKAPNQALNGIPVVGDGVVWYEGNWKGPRAGDPDSGDETSPLWFTPIDNPGGRNRISDPAHEFVFGFATGQDDSRVVYVASGVDRSLCDLQSVDPLDPASGVKLAENIPCESIRGDSLLKVRRTDPNQREAVVYHTDSGWWFRWADGTGEARSLPASWVSRPVLSLDGSWAYFVGTPWELWRRSLIDDTAESVQLAPSITSYFIVR